MENFNDRFYPESLSSEEPVLKNKLNIRDRDELEQTELEISIPRIYSINEKTVSGNWDLEHLKKYHKYIFGELYEWGGEIRKFDVVKYERVLSGASVEYTNPLYIASNLKNILAKVNLIDLKGMSKKEQVDSFCDAIVDVWQCHPFNEGNTRCITKFMTDLFKNKGMKIDTSLFSENNEYFRSAIVLYTYDQENYLKEIVEDAIERANLDEREYIPVNDLPFITLDFVKGKIENNTLEGKYFKFNKQKFQILDIEKAKGKAQADAIIQNCDTQEIFVEKNFAGSNPFKLKLNQKIDNIQDYSKKSSSHME